MKKPLQAEQIMDCGISREKAIELAHQINTIEESRSSEHTWQFISKNILTPTLPFKLHLLLYSYCYPTWDTQIDSAPAWIPDPEFIQKTHLAEWMKTLDIDSVKAFHAWTIAHYEEFWQTIIQKLAIRFQKQPEKICDLSLGVESPVWLKGARFNIADSCFNASPEKIAIITQDNQGCLQQISYGELNQLSNQIANGLIQQGFHAGDAIAVDMPMTKEAVAIYLGIIKMGGVVVSIADSFSPQEIATRLRIAATKAIFTQDYILRGDKKLPLYEKVIAANAPRAFVIACQEKLSLTLRKEDLAWDQFLSANTQFTSHACDPMSACNILFSSGTTGDPKAIPWNHTTPIKAASDAYLHQNIGKHDVLAWPTNLGWMMGPWLIFAALINQATLALYPDVPRERAFGEFIQNAKVTMLGVVPTLVATWRQSQCMEGLNWQSITRFTSTGECSNAEDMLYLMSLAVYQPVIEYCGGTEVGGSYISSTMIEKNYPSLFSTKVMGLDFVLLDDEGKPTNNGEVALIPPSIGLSTQLLNADQHKVYYENMPTYKDKVLRRHGDQVQCLPNGYYSVLGRVDDTMNLGAIKVSSVEIERVLTGIEDIIETAAIAVSPSNQGGPSQLIIYAATGNSLDKSAVRKIMQEKINKHLNPLFKIHDVVLIKELPKTASNKIMRRVLRKQYEEKK